MKIKKADVVKAVTKALDADACPEDMGDVWNAARNYMFSCDKCLASFAAAVTRELNKSRAK